MASKIKDIDHGWRNIKSKAREMKKAVVRVGVLQNSGMAKERDENGIPVTSDVTLVEVAFWNEYGTKNIPERPFIRTTALENRGVYARRLGKEAEAIFAGKTSVDNALGRIGELARGHVKKKIRAIRTPPNAPATIKKKGSSNPLIDTSTLLNAINYEIKK